VTEAVDFSFPRGQQLLHRKFWRDVQIAAIDRKSRDMRFGARHRNNGAEIGFHEPVLGKPAAYRRKDFCTRQEKRTAVCVALFTLPIAHAKGPRFPAGATQAMTRTEFTGIGRRGRLRKGSIVVKVIASDVRKGNVLEHEDGKLYVVMSAESFRPGKGTPTTTITMRRIVDGLKTQQTYKTTDGLEKAFVEEVKHTYLFEDGDQGYVFMNPESYEQITVTKDMAGDAAAYLAPEMEVYLTMFDGQALSLELPSKVTLEVMETEPVTKGQTASSSYKPAKLSNGTKTMVPPHIGAGTRIIVSTEDGSYQERAKD
jgi:elongation factor P